MYYAQVKFTRRAVPSEYEFPNKKEAERFCNYMKNHNPNVRWAEAKDHREYPKQPLSKAN